MSVSTNPDQKGISSVEVVEPQKYFISTLEMGIIFKSFDEGKGINPENIMDKIVEKYIGQEGIAKEDILYRDGSLWEFLDFDEKSQTLKIKIFFPYYKDERNREFTKVLSLMVFSQ